MRRVSSLLLLVAGSVAIAGCPLDSPTEVRDNGQQFPVTATWSATAAPIEPATVAGSLTAEQHLGFRVNASFTVTGDPSTTYQWRIFRGDCTINVPQSTSAPDGLVLFATSQSYPDVTVGTAGSASVDPAIAGELDSLTAYSVRIRLSATSTNWNGTNPIACGDLQRTPAG
jgi:hypothetical protein